MNWAAAGAAMGIVAYSAMALAILTKGLAAFMRNDEDWYGSAALGALLILVEIGLLVGLTA